MEIIETISNATYEYVTVTRLDAREETKKFIEKYRKDFDSLAKR